MKEPALNMYQRSRFSDSFSHRLTSYALAAGAAGVTLLASAGPCAGEIIYKRTHHVIENRTSYKLDLNQDGTADLSIQNQYFHSCTSDSCRTSENLIAKLARANKLVHNFYGAVAMKSGMRIGAGDVFRGAKEPMVNIGQLSYPYGSWVNVKDRYLGIQFKIKDQTHYGWARLSVQVGLRLTITATLTGYAYETIPNKPIIAGKTTGPDLITLEPGSLGWLAQGSARRLGK
jgi:hypothetical protein